MENLEIQFEENLAKTLEVLAKQKGIAVKDEVDGENLLYECITFELAAPTNLFDVIKEWNGERVVTAKDIAELHERDVKRVNEQFNRNIDKFELGKDYFQLTREEMRKSQFATALSKYSNNDIENLFTERWVL